MLRSDNGSQFTSSEFQKFIKSKEIKHLTSSPAYARSNGCAERYVQTAKNLLKKCLAEGKPYYDGLRNLRNTPISNTVPSPAALLQGRVLPDGMPRNIDTLFPKSYDNSAVRKEFEKIRSEQKYYHDRHARGSLPVLQPNDEIHVKVCGRWLPGTVEKPDENTPRSYWVTTKDGRVFRRTRTDILANANNGNQSIPLAPKEGTSQQHVFPTPDPDIVCTIPPDECQVGGYRTRYGRLSVKPDRLSYK